MTPVSMEFITFAVGFPYRYQQYSPAWFMYWPYDIILGIVMISIVAWLLSRAMRGELTSRQMLLLTFLIVFTLGYMVLNSILIKAVP